MNKLIKYFNENYGEEYGKIAYPRTTIQIYQTYQTIKSYGIDNEELIELLHGVNLPNPKSIEEKELYADCLYNKDDSEIKIDTSNLISKENPVFTGSISLGRKADTTIGTNSAALGSNTEASGGDSHAEGYQTIASGESSHAEGDSTKALGINSHAEGELTEASGTSSHTEGYNTTASGERSHAEGYETTALGCDSHAEGSETTAEADYSHAEGNNTTASGSSSHAEGYDTTASGDDSHAEGICTKASSEHQHVQGKYNVEDSSSKYAHIVGNGTSDTKRSNAHTLDWDGNGWYKGKLSQEGTPTEDKDLTTKKYVDTNNNRLLTSIYGKRYNFQINEDDFNSLYNFLYGHERDSMEINLNSVSIDGINEILNGDTWYDTVSFNNAIILNLESTGSGGIVLFMKDENSKGKIQYITFALNINESNIPVFSYHEFKKYNINDELFNPGIFNNEFHLLDEKCQYVSISNNTNIIFPDVYKFIEIHLYISTTSALNLTFSKPIKWDKELTIEANKTYELIFKYINEKVGWIGKYEVYS